MNLQPTDLSNELIRIVPLEEHHFDKLFELAEDPLIWEQHPNRERYKKEVFEAFFKAGLESKGALAVIDNHTGEMIGSSRFYEYDEANRTVAIGYTFLTRKYWATPYNRNLKTLMLNHAFKYVDTVIFHIGETNFRSQKAIEKLGAVKFREDMITYGGDRAPNMNYFYKITKENWLGDNH